MISNGFWVTIRDMVLVRVHRFILKAQRGNFELLSSAVIFCAGLGVLIICECFNKIKHFSEPFINSVRLILNNLQATETNNALN